ncbi:MAG TPA: MauE/DoxX family redox-associated membrane protein [Opitutaceae bacterium]|jgi:uncharacterized membrane protein YphA (DoxX/SURF4 family)
MRAAVRLVAPVILAAIFAYSGWVKLAHPADFAAAVAAYRLLPPAGIGLVAVALPVFELLLAATLVVPQWRQEGAGIALALLFLFFTATAAAQARHLNVDCGCFGPDPWRPLRAVPPLIRDGALMAAAAIARLAPNLDRGARRR